VSGFFRLFCDQIGPTESHLYNPWSVTLERSRVTKMNRLIQ